MKNLVYPIILIALSGCASSPQTENNPELSYDNIKYENSSIPAADARVKFNEDISSCKLKAEKQLEASIKNAKLLASIYGQPIKIDDLKLMSKGHVAMCMAGDKQTGSVGKGWSVVSGS
ncbi:hypothetical protein [Pseudomonas sp. TMP9]|uniref:hypothetical protein n=1 Tax=unclassified Pseudomonas TaxID=196821 RepID=UPI0030D0C3E5